MSVAGLLVRFTGIYVLLLIAIVAVKSLLSIEGGQVNLIALAGATLGSIHWFSRRNRRALAKGELRNAILGMLAVDVALQLVLTVGTLAAAGGGLPLTVLVVIIGTVAVLNGLLIMATAWLLNRSIAKNFEKQAQQVFE
jgi:hypothetical protein